MSIAGIDIGTTGCKIAVYDHDGARFHAYREYPAARSRSEHEVDPRAIWQAIRDLIREELVREQWRENSEVTGAITLVYDHHHRGLVSRLLDIQHDYHHTIFSSQHIHLDHDNCLEIIITKGKAQIIEALYGKLKSAKGVKHAGFAMATTGDISA